MCFFLNCFQTKFICKLKMYHYFTMSIMKDQYINVHNIGVIVPFKKLTPKEKNYKIKNKKIEGTSQSARRYQFEV